MSAKKNTEENPTKQTPLDLAIEAIKKAQGSGAILVGKDSIPGVEFFSSGCPSIDKVLGGGWAKGRILELMGPESSGKAQPLTAQVLTPSGWKQMSQLEIGSVVCTPDGGESSVIGIFPQGKKKVYKIILDDKSTTTCTEDHLWLLYTRHTDLGEVLSTKDIINRQLVSENGCRKFRIPTIEPLKMQGEQSLPIDPYLLGLLLGDGSFRGSTIKYSTIDQELLNNLKTILEKDFPEMCISEKFGDCDYHLRNKERSHNRTKLQQLITSLGLAEKYSQEKFIPEQYLIASIEQRARLLQGLMDTDGSVSDNHSISFSTSSPKLSKQFEFLARSLGFRCTTSSRITKYTSTNGNKVDGLPSFRSNLLVQTSNIRPVTLTKKVNNLLDVPSNYRFRFIASIEEFGEEECQCIKIDHPDELYITDDFIVTHNTTLALHAIAEIQKAGGTAAIVDAEHALDIVYAEALGVNTEKLLISQPSSGEDALDVVEMLVSSGSVAFIVIDSVAALVPRVELECGMGDSVMGVQARLMGQAMRKLAGKCHKTNTTLMFINQIRMKIGLVYGNPETTSGGNALKFYASQRVDVRRTGGTKEGEIFVANKTKVKCIKNKCAPPFKECEFEIRYGEGIDIYSDILNTATEKNIIEKAGAWYSYQGVQVGQGSVHAREWLIEHPVETEEIKKKLMNV